MGAGGVTYLSGGDGDADCDADAEAEAQSFNAQREQVYDACGVWVCGCVGVSCVCAMQRVWQGWVRWL